MLAPLRVGKVCLVPHLTGGCPGMMRAQHVPVHFSAPARSCGQQDVSVVVGGFVTSFAFPWHVVDSDFHDPHVRQHRAETGTSSLMAKSSATRQAAIGEHTV
jgi:hypothetical protein